MELLTIILLLKGVHMTILLLLLYVLLLIKLYYGLMRLNKLHVLTRYKVYDTKRRGKDIQQTRRDLAIDALEITVIVATMLIVIGMGGA